MVHAHKVEAAARQVMLQPCARRGIGIGLCACANGAYHYPLAVVKGHSLMQGRPRPLHFHSLQLQTMTQTCPAVGWFGQASRAKFAMARGREQGISEHHMVEACMDFILANPHAGVPPLSQGGSLICPCHILDPTPNARYDTVCDVCCSRETPHSYWFGFVKSDSVEVSASASRPGSPSCGSSPQIPSGSAPPPPGLLRL